MMIFAGSPAFRCGHGAIFKFWFTTPHKTGLQLKTSRFICCGRSQTRADSHVLCAARRGWRKCGVTVSYLSLVPKTSPGNTGQIYFSTETGSGPENEVGKSNNAQTVALDKKGFRNPFAKPYLYLNKEVLKDTKQKPSEQYFNYTENNFMDVVTAKRDYLLDDNDLSQISQLKRKSPYSSSFPHAKGEQQFICVVWTKDVEKIAMDKWKSKANLEREKVIKKYSKTTYTPVEEKVTLMDTLKNAFSRDAGAVVMVALFMNVCNAGFKGSVWIMTGSPSMFSEFMHSVGDVMNQLLLAVGRFLSMKNPDESHPYGYRNHIHIWSILSGTVIFSLGCGFTLYNGILGLWHPVVMDATSIHWSLMVLAGTFATESGSLIYAIHQIWKDSKASKMSFIQYVKEGDDPLCNVVLLEDTVSVLGVLVCAGAITASHSLGFPMLDAVGSIVISGMMGMVSGFLFKSNVDKLLGKSLPYEDEIKKYMESDRFIHAVLDNKTLDMGDQSRFKSEVVLDARLITNHFLQTEVDMDAMLVKWKSVKTTEDMEKFLEEFGSQVYEQIVAHVDRKEYDIKKRFPEIRHIDIEPS